MKTFIVYWCLSITFQIPCPTSKQVDVFSVENIAYRDCLKYTKKYIIDYNMCKKFHNIDSSITFYNKLKKIKCDSVRLLCY